MMCNYKRRLASGASEYDEFNDYLDEVWWQACHADRALYEDEALFDDWYVANRDKLYKEWEHD